MQHPVPANARVLPDFHRPPAINHNPNLCAMVIEGEPVWVDIENIGFEAGARAAIIDHDGKIKIQRIDPSVCDYNPMGLRSAYGEPYPSGYGGTCRNRVAVIGVVVNPYTNALISNDVIEGELA